jgi:hypothetical protein
VLKSFGFWNILDFGFSARDVQVVKSMQIVQISKKIEFQNLKHLWSERSLNKGCLACMINPYECVLEFYILSVHLVNLYGGWYYCYFCCTWA